MQPFFAVFVLLGPKGRGAGLPLALVKRWLLSGYRALSLNVANIRNGSIENLIGQRTEAVLSLAQVLVGREGNANEEVDLGEQMRPLDLFQLKKRKINYQRNNN